MAVVRDSVWDRIASTDFDIWLGDDARQSPKYIFRVGDIVRLIGLPSQEEYFVVRVKNYSLECLMPGEDEGRIHIPIICAEPVDSNTVWDRIGVNDHSG